MSDTDILSSVMSNREFKKGSAELAILASIEEQPRHGYDIAKVIRVRSGGELTFRVASLYPTLYRLEARGLVAARWVEKAGQRRARYYRLTAAGRRVLQQQRDSWRAFSVALDRVAGLGES